MKLHEVIRNCMKLDRIIRNCMKLDRIIRNCMKLDINYMRLDVDSTMLGCLMFSCTSYQQFFFSTSISDEMG